MKEIDWHEGCALLVSWKCKEEKMWWKSADFQEQISRQLLKKFSLHLVCEYVYRKDINYVNLVQIGLVVVEIRGVCDMGL